MTAEPFEKDQLTALFLHDNKRSLFFMFLDLNNLFSLEKLLSLSTHCSSSLKMRFFSCRNSVSDRGFGRLRGATATGTAGRGGRAGGNTGGTTGGPPIGGRTKKNNHFLSLCK